MEENYKEDESTQDLKIVKGKGIYILLEDDENNYFLIGDTDFESFNSKKLPYPDFDKEWIEMNKHNFDFIVEFNNKDIAINKFNSYCEKIEENYKDMKERHQEEFNSFPIKFAFSDEQFKKAMEELGLNENDKDKIVGIGAGGFMKKEDLDSYREMNKRHNEELSEAIKKDIDGTGFVKEMFLDELRNHEYGYTGDIEDTLYALGITIQDLNKNENLRNGLELAKQEILQYETQEEDEEEL